MPCAVGPRSSAGACPGRSCGSRRESTGTLAARAGGPRRLCDAVFTGGGHACCRMLRRGAGARRAGFRAGNGADADPDGRRVVHAAGGDLHARPDGHDGAPAGGRGDRAHGRGRRGELGPRRAGARAGHQAVCGQPGRERHGLVRLRRGVRVHRRGRRGRGDGLRRDGRGRGGAARPGRGGSGCRGSPVPAGGAGGGSPRASGRPPGAARAGAARGAPGGGEAVGGGSRRAGTSSSATSRPGSGCPIRSPRRPTRSRSCCATCGRTGRSRT